MDISELKCENLLNLDETNARAIFDGLAYPWEALPVIASFLLVLAGQLSPDYERMDENVWIGKGTKIDDSVLIIGPAIIGCDCQIRHGAYIRENVIIGDGVVIGNSTEVKNSIIFNKAQAPHFNYIGDSILGFKAHLGAGVILSNLKSTDSLVFVKSTGLNIDTGLRKFGAIIGDKAEIGCNSVLYPGTVVGRGSIVYPLTPARGVIPAGYILKNKGDLIAIK